MRRGFLVLAAAAVLGTGLGAPADARRAERHCGHGKVIARNSQSVIFLKRDRLWACWRGNGRNWRLWKADGEYSRYDVTPAAVAGHFAAAALLESGPTTDQRLVALVNLRNGEPQYMAANYTDTPVGTTAASVFRLVLTSKGQAVFTTNSGIQREGEPVNYHIDMIDSHGRGQLIDSGPGLDPMSLELDGRTLSWVKDGETKTGLLN